MRGQRYADIAARALAAVGGPFGIWVTYSPLITNSIRQTFDLVVYFAMAAVISMSIGWALWPRFVKRDGEWSMAGALAAAIVTLWLTFPLSILTFAGYLSVRMASKDGGFELMVLAFAVARTGLEAVAIVSAVYVCAAWIGERLTE